MSIQPRDIVRYARSLQDGDMAYRFMVLECDDRSGMPTAKIRHIGKIVNDEFIATCDTFPPIETLETKELVKI